MRAALEHYNLSAASAREPRTSVRRMRRHTSEKAANGMVRPCSYPAGE
jgi:hypothetical protein